MLGRWRPRGYDAQFGDHITITIDKDDVLVAIDSDVPDGPLKAGIWSVDCPETPNDVEPIGLALQQLVEALENARKKKGTRRDDNE